MPTFGKIRFGKKRAINCRCEYNFTCGACLNDAVERNLADKNSAPQTNNVKQNYEKTH